MNSIPNFIGNDPLEIVHVFSAGWNLISLRQFASGMTFHHTMKTEQARALAATLFEMADAADAKAVEVIA